MTIVRTILILLALNMGTVHAQKISWIIGKVGDWDASFNWEGGNVPSSTDSVEIQGPDSHVTLNSTQSALHLSIISAKVTITPLGSLTIDNSPGNGIYLPSGRIENEGNLIISNVQDRGIWSQSDIINSGSITIYNTNNALIYMLGNGGDTLNNSGNLILAKGLALTIQIAHLLNTGTIEIDSAVSAGIVLATLAEANFSNTSKVTIKNSPKGVDARQISQLTNAGNINIKNYIEFGMKSRGAISNTGDIFFSGSNTEIAIQLDSFSCCGEVYLGELTNDGFIEIFDAVTGIFLQNSTSLTNSGKIEIGQGHPEGIYAQARSIISLFTGSEIEIYEVGVPLEIEAGANLQVDLGAILSAEN